MSQAAADGAPRKLPIADTLTAGLKIGFRHFWILILAFAVAYGIIGAFYWPTFTQMFSVMGELQRTAVSAPPADPQVIMEQQRLLWSSINWWSYGLAMLVAIIIGSGVIVVALRVMELGPGRAFQGSFGQWAYRVLLLIWRHICLFVVLFLVLIAFGLACLVPVGIGALLAKVLPGVLIGLLGVVFFVAALLAFFYLYATIYAVAGVSFVGSSCDEGVTLREAYAALKGNLFRAGGVNILAYVAMSLAISMVMSAVMVGLIAMLVSMHADGGPAAMAQAVTSPSFFLSIFGLEFAMIIPGMIWWYGVMVAIYRFAKGVATGSPETAAA